MSSNTSRKMSVYIFIITMAVGVSFAVGTELSTNVCSPFLAKDCSCFKVKEYEIQCPASKLDVVMHLYPDKYIQIDCYNQTEYKLNVLPDVNINVERFKVRFCLLEVFKFKNVLNKFNITHLKRLEIEDCILGNSSLSQIEATFFEGITSVESLSISSASKTYATNVFDNFPNLIQLYLEQNKLTEIGYIFENNQNLKVLHLSRNSLKDLPNGVFQKLINLQELHLWKNELTEITQEYFKGLTNLKSLELSINLIGHIAENAFSDLNQLVNISLRSNRLGNISSNIFKNNYMLENIRIDRNPYLIISDYVFANLSNLKSLTMANSHLKHMFEHTFENCSNLKVLEMQDNELTYLPPLLFKTLKKLTTLNLSNNKLKSLGDMLSNLENLQKLNLEHNELTSINSTTFNGLSKLQHLNLKKNKISYIDLRAFTYQSNLITMDLSFNQWREEDYVFSYLEQIEKLLLSHNNISTFPVDVLQSAVSLKELDLSYNYLSEIEVESFIKVSRFNVIINLSHNKISTVNFDHAEFTARQNMEHIRQDDVLNSNITNTQVNVSSNPFTCNCYNFDLINYLRGRLDPDLMSLIDIKVQDTKCFLPYEFKHISIKDLHPEHITCEYNVSCPTECRCFDRPYDSAIVVDCSFRNLTYFPPLSLKPIKEKKIEVNMIGNSLESGPNDHQGYEMVKNLFLSNNKIQHFNWCPPHIEEIKLDHNNLKTLSTDVLKTFNSSINFSKLTLGDNSWTCGCSALELQNFVRQHFLKIVDRKSIFCEGENTLLINKNDMCKSKLIIAIQIVIPILSLFLLTAIAIAFYFRYKQEIKIWLFSKKLCMWFVTEEELDKDKKYDIFLSFSHKDEDFIAENLVPLLEKSFKLCIHSRDWIPGELINDQIVDSVYNSRRTLVVLSNNFLESAWGKLEFLMAHKQSIEEGRPRVIVIKLGELNMDKMNDDFKAYIKTNTYVEWGERWFWKKLLYALPHSSKDIEKTNQKHANMMLKIDDKFELAAQPISHPDSTPPVISVDSSLLKKHPLTFNISSSISSFQTEVPLIRQE